MAILEHFSACILIDGKPCQEYAVEEDEEQSETTSEEYPKITKYVEVVAGAPFTIRVEPTKSFEFGKGNSIRVGLYSDGEKLLGKIQQEAQVRAKEILKISRRTVDNGEDVRPFKFGNINFRDTETSDRAALLQGKYADLATISITIELATSRRVPYDKSRTNEEVTDGIPEAAVKGGVASVHASFGDAQRRERPKRSLWIAQPIGKKPLAVFSFKCRTEEDLQKLSIIPRPRSPTPLEDRPIESLSFAETRELLLRKKAAEELGRVKIKQEKKEATLRELSAIKRSRDEAEDEDEAIEVVTIRKKKRTEPADIIELD